tara:strand:- start:17 stop:403 length:387 start_codon:yes stop_codon:yes gene_type:complete
MNEEHCGSVLQQQGLPIRKISPYESIDDKICRSDCMLCYDPDQFNDNREEYDEQSNSKTINDIYTDILENTDDVEQVFAKLKAWCKMNECSDTWIRKHLENDSRCTEKYKTSIEHHRIVGEYDTTIKE